MLSVPHPPGVQSAGPWRYGGGVPFCACEVVGLYSYSTLRSTGPNGRSCPSPVPAPTHASSLPLGQRGAALPNRASLGKRGTLPIRTCCLLALCCSRVFATCCWCCTLHTSATRVPLGTSTPGSTAAYARLCRVHSLLAGVASPAQPHGKGQRGAASWRS